MSRPRLRVPVYGYTYLLDVSSDASGWAPGVLIRALEPIEFLRGARKRARRRVATCIRSLSISSVLQAPPQTAAVRRDPRANQRRGAACFRLSQTGADAFGRDWTLKETRSSGALAGHSRLVGRASRIFRKPATIEIALRAPLLASQTN